MSSKKFVISAVVIIAVILLGFSGVKIYHVIQNNNSSAQGQQSDMRLVNQANLTLSNTGALNPTIDEDSNIISLAESLINADSSGVTVQVVSSNNPQIQTDGSINYSETAVTGNVTFLITKNNVTKTQTINVTVPARQSVSNVNEESVADAKAGLISATLKPVVGVDSNIVIMAQSIVDKASSGVKVTILLTNNKQISADGTITYGGTAVNGSVKFSLTKNLVIDNVTTSITVPSKTVTSNGLGVVAGRDITTSTTTTTTRPVTTTTVPPTTTSTTATTSTTVLPTTTTSTSTTTIPPTTTSTSTTTTTTSTTSTTTSSTTTTTTVPSSDAQDVATAKAALASVSLHPIEGTDTNVSPIAQDIVDNEVGGVTVSFQSSSNSQVSVSGVITYGSSQVSGNVTFSLSKGSENDTQVVNVIVPATGTSVNVMSYGAAGNGITDDTAAIQSAIDYINGAGGGTVNIPDGTYLVTADSGRINWKSNVSLVLSTNAIIQAKPSANSTYAIIEASNASNISITGGTVKGDRYTHTGSGGEWGMGIEVDDSTNVYIGNISVVDCWGDGIYIGSNSETGFNTNVTIENFSVSNCRRNGISIISVKGLLMQDGYTFNMNGTDPQVGVDLEPNYPTQYLQNVVVKNLTSTNNVSCGFLFGYGGGDFQSTTNNSDVTLINYVASGNGSQDYGSQFYNDYTEYTSSNSHIHITITP